MDNGQDSQIKIMKIPIILQIYFIQQPKQVLESITLVNGDDINIESYCLLDVSVIMKMTISQSTNVYDDGLFAKLTLTDNWNGIKESG